MALVDLKSNLADYRKKEKYSDQVENPASTRISLVDRSSTLGEIKNARETPQKESPVEVVPTVKEGLVKDPNIETEQTQLEGNVIDPNFRIEELPKEGYVTDPDVEITPSQIENNIEIPKIEITEQELEGIVTDPKIEVFQQKLEDIVTDPNIEVFQQQLEGIVTDPEIETFQQQLQGIVTDPEIETEQQQLEDIVTDPEIETIQTQLEGNTTDPEIEVEEYSDPQLESTFRQQEIEVYNNNGVILDNYLTLGQARGLQKKDEVRVSNNDNYFKGSSTIPFIRGGSAAQKIAEEDTRRFQRWLESPEGVRWVTLQQGLHLMNPNVEFRGLIAPTKVFNPLSIVTNFQTAHTGIRIPSKGTDANDVFRDSYENVVRDLDLEDNRMIKLHKELIKNDINKLELPKWRQDLNDKFGNAVQGLRDVVRIGREVAGSVQALLAPLGILTGNTNLATRINNIVTGVDIFLDVAFPEDQVIQTLTSDGGPNSVLGIGQTRIFRYENTVAAASGVSYRITSYNDPYSVGEGLGQPTLTLNIPGIEDNSIPGVVATELDPSKGNFYTEKFKYNQARGPFRGAQQELTVSETSKDVQAFDYGRYTYTQLTRPGRGGSKDLIKFFFTGPRDSKNTPEAAMAFEANIDSFNDNTQATPDVINYIGRADPAFIYRNYLRSFDLSFKLVSSNKKGMRANYRKLNYLTGFLTPDYDDCKMVNPFMRITIGDYLRNTPVILTGLFNNITGENTWEILDSGDFQQLPHVLEVNVSGYVITDRRPKMSGWFYGFEEWLDPFPIDSCPEPERPVPSLPPVTRVQTRGTVSGPIGGTGVGQDGVDVSNQLVLDGLRANL